ncbi:MAG: SDR family NAD(P)-dependent oxidoreductase [Verrucomicrobiales bacterium]|jgi:acyl transferase domain-containing protein/thioesterase domain-containing protein/acyl carrier protein|nr:SDR family NAD(P)-dependent oxidoreductase [Verrucomicrobiales bacterium]
MPQKSPIAVIGLGCRFPGSPGPEALWDRLAAGEDLVTRWPKERWDLLRPFFPHLPAYDPDDAPWGGFIEDIDRFDADLFRMTPREAKALDPQQRLLLEIAWEAFEDAGQGPNDLSGSRTGVFLGMSSHNYGVTSYNRAETDLYTTTGTSNAVAANRLSYQWNLRGPSMTIDTACSSSLVAVHLACRSLWSGESTASLAGGVSLMLLPQVTQSFASAGFMASDGRCKAFDARADGYVRGEGAGLVLLKLLPTAIADGDRIHCVIRGTAMNQDGRSNGLTAPNRHAQSQLLRDAYEDAGMESSEVDYIEAHGTGTKLGDPMEAKALAEALGTARRTDRPCLVGAIKTNIGHLEAAAGIAGLIKTVLAIRHQRIPSNLHYQSPNPLIPFDSLALKVPTRLTPWPNTAQPARAGVSAFGFGGTNAHVVLEQAPAPSIPQYTDDRASTHPHILTLNARTPDALNSLARRYVNHFERHQEISVADAAYTSQVGRAALRYRTSLTARSREEMLAKLKETAMSSTSKKSAVTPSPSVAFLFTGQGAQYHRMGLALYKTQSVFRQQMDACAKALSESLEIPLIDILRGAGNDPILLDQTNYTQPALFALELSLARLWISWGIQPDYLLGHSLGEYVAATLAGVFSERDGIRLIAARGRLMAALPQNGSMAVAETDAEWVKAQIKEESDSVAIAAINAPDQVVLSGEQEAMDNLIASIRNAGHKVRPLQVSHAFHSPLMEPMLGEFEEIVRSTQLYPPDNGLKLISNLTGRFVGDEIAQPEYWCQQIRNTVRFAESVRSLEKCQCDVFLEIGPHAILNPLVTRNLSEEPSGNSPLYVQSLIKGKDDSRVMHESLGALHDRGCQVEWAALHQGKPRSRIELPTYPFQRSSFWIDPGPVPASSLQANHAKDYYELSWEEQELHQVVNGAPARWFLLLDDKGVGQALAEQLRITAPGDDVIIIRRGLQCQQVSEDHWTIRPGNVDDICTLLSHWKTKPDIKFHHLVHLWSLDAPALAKGFAPTQAAKSLTCQSILALVRALSTTQTKMEDHTNLRISIVTQGAAPLGDNAPPVSSLTQYFARGLGKSLALEHPEWWHGMIDLEEHRSSKGTSIQGLTEALRSESPCQELALRNGLCFATRLKHQKLTPSPSPNPIHFQSPATYLVTGGFGGLGSEVLPRLHRIGLDHLTVLGRRPADDPYVVERLAALSRLGAKILYQSVDVSDLQALRACMNSVITIHELTIKGIVHAAGMTGVESAKDMDWTTFDSALHAKGDGAWHLHTLSQELSLPLDNFILFSSIAGTWGSKGQTHYSAANHFLDGLAHYRRSQGLPAISIAWGPWEANGMASESFRERLESLGIRALSTAQALDWLECALTKNHTPELPPVPVVVEADWNQVAASFRAQGSGQMFEHLTDTSTTPACFSPIPTDAQALEPEVRQIWQDCLQVDPIDLDDSFFDLGGDSMVSTSLFVQIRTRWGMEMSGSALLRAPTLRQFCQEILLAHRSGAVGNETKVNSVVTIRKGKNGEMPFFWIHAIGGGDGIGFVRFHGLFDDLSDRMGGTCYGLRSHAEPFETVEAMARQFIEDMRVVHPTGPYALGAYCTSGVVAYEMARQLSEAGEEVSALFMIDTPPAVSASKPSMARRFLGLCQNTPHWLFDNARSGPTRLARKIGRGGTIAKRKIGQRLGMTSRPSIELSDVIDMERYPVASRKYAEAHWRAYRSYQPEGYRGTLTLFIPKIRSLLWSDSVSAWRSFAPSGMEVEVIPGNHSSMLESPHVDELVSRMRRRIRRSEAPPV